MDQKKPCILAELLLSGIGGTPAPSPLNGKNPLSSVLRVSLKVFSFFFIEHGSVVIISKICQLKQKKAEFG